MTVPTYIAVNQNGTDIILTQLRLTVPGHDQVNLSNFNETWRIQSDLELKGYVTDDRLLINNGSVTLNKSESLQYLSPIAAKEDLSNVKANADLTSWSTVSAALGGQAGANSSYVFKSNGSGGGTMSKNVRVVPKRITVGPSGSDVDYYTIESAIAAAVTGGVSATNPWEILVSPGTYAENPLTMSPGIFLISDCGNNPGTATITAINPSNDLINISGGLLCGFVLSGVTDTERCLIRINTHSINVVVRGLRLYNCSNGIVVENDATALLENIICWITGTGQRITTAITNNGSKITVLGFSAIVPAAVASLYTENPIQTGIKTTNDGYSYIEKSRFDISYHDMTGECLFADNGSSVTVLSSVFENSRNCCHIGASGSNTHVILSNTRFDNNNINILCESSTGVIYASGNIITASSRSMVEGSQFIGTDLLLTTQSYRMAGDVRYQFTTDKTLNMEDFFVDFGYTGICEGGTVTEGVGLNVNIEAGEGFIKRYSPYEDLESVEWDGGSITLQPSATNYVHYDSTNRILTSSTSPTGPTELLLATVITDSSDILYNHKTIISSENVGYKLQEYLLDTRMQVLKNGLLTINETYREISVSSGNYYLGIETIPYSGSDGYANWTYYYGSNGHHSVANQSQINLTQYDSNGTLTTMSDGYYRKDYLILTSDGRLSLIYGSSEHSTLLDVEDAPSEPIPTILQYSYFPLCEIVVRKTTGIYEIIDKRPVKSWFSGGGTAGGGVTAHSDLSGLNADDHTQYLLASGTREMSGDLQMGGFDITNIGTIDSVNITDHSSRHMPGGADALTTGIPVAISVGVSPSAGSGSSYALNDHQHGITTGTPITINTANSDGTASTVSRSDHVHAHGNQTSGSLHAVATTTVNGFMSFADKLRLNELSVGNGNNVYNGTAYTLETKRAVTVVGFDITSGLYSVDYADKDNPDLRPAIGILQESIAPGGIGYMVSYGFLSGMDTSIYQLTDQLILGNDGYLVRPPPDNILFTTGEIQNLAIVSKVGTVDGEFLVSIDGQNPVNATEILALDGTAGTPSGTNKYVTNSDPRLSVGDAGTATIRSIGTTGTTACAGNDSRLSDDRTATGLRTATTIVGTSSATAPTNGQVLTATSSTAAAWSTPLALTATAPADVTKTTASVGVSTAAARADHKHDISTAATIETTVGGTNAEGSSTSLARADHTHALVGYGTTSGTICQGNDSRLSDDRITSQIRSATTIISTSAATAPTAGQVLTASSGTAAAWTTPLTLTSSAPANVTKAAADVGVATSVARADHKHDVTTAAASALTVGSTNAEGSSTSLARADHIHGISAGVPVSIGTTNSAGVATTFSRSDHVHQGALGQTIDNYITVDTTTTSTTFVDLLSSTFTTNAGYLLVNFTVCGDNATNNRYVAFRLVVDDVAIRSTGYTSAVTGQPHSAALQARVSVAAGSHTVKIQWLVSASTGRIRPVTNPDWDHASLLIRESLY